MECQARYQGSQLTVCEPLAVVQDESGSRLKASETFIHDLADSFVQPVAGFTIFLGKFCRPRDKTIHLLASLLPLQRSTRGTRGFFHTSQACHCLCYDVFLSLQRLLHTLTRR